MRLAAVVIFAPQAVAFGAIRGLGQNAEHETITRRGLASFGFGLTTLSMLAGARQKDAVCAEVGRAEELLRVEGGRPSR